MNNQNNPYPDVTNQPLLGNQAPNQGYIPQNQGYMPPPQNYPAQGKLACNIRPISSTPSSSRLQPLQCSSQSRIHP